jgi:phospholipase C
VETNISDWRRRTVGDLTSAFRFHEARDAPALPDTTGAFNLAQYEASQLPLPTVPGANQSMPEQERGKRPQVG